MSSTKGGQQSGCKSSQYHGRIIANKIAGKVHFLNNLKFFHYLITQKLYFEAAELNRTHKTAESEHDKTSKYSRYLKVDRLRGEAKLQTAEIQVAATKSNKSAWHGLTQHGQKYLWKRSNGLEFKNPSGVKEKREL